jgi:hypothetical protein
MQEQKDERSLDPNKVMVEAIVNADVATVNRCLDGRASANYQLDSYTGWQKLVNVGKTILFGTANHFFTMIFGSSGGKSTKGDTVLHLAARCLRDDDSLKNRLEIMRLLIAHGADKDAQNDEYEKPVHVIPLELQDVRARQLLEPAHYTITSAIMNAFD